MKNSTLSAIAAVASSPRMRGAAAELFSLQTTQRALECASFGGAQSKCLRLQLFKDYVSGE
jgi:hypothetical protein